MGTSDSCGCFSCHKMCLTLSLVSFEKTMQNRSEMARETYESFGKEKTCGMQWSLNVDKAIFGVQCSTHGNRTEHLALRC